MAESFYVSAISSYLTMGVPAEDTLKEYTIELIDFLKHDKPQEAMQWSMDNCNRLLTACDHNPILCSAIKLRIMGAQADLLFRNEGLEKVASLYRREIQECCNLVWGNARWRYQLSLGKLLLDRGYSRILTYHILRALAAVLLNEDLM